MVSTMQLGYATPGRYIWDGADRLEGNPLAHATDEELKNEGENWPPFKAGLFGPDLAKLKAAKADLDRSIRLENLTRA